MRRFAMVALLLGAGLLAGPPPALAGGGCHAEAATEGTGTQVVMQDACFGPMVLRVEPGQSVTWTNRDDFPHVVAGTGWGSFDDVRPGTSVTFRFDASGVYSYSCFYHPGMNGVVLAGDVSKPGTAIGGVAAAPPTSPPPRALQAPPGGAAEDLEPAVSTGAGTGWKVATFVGFGLFLIAAAALAFERLGRRRAEVQVQPT